MHGKTPEAPEAQEQPKKRGFFRHILRLLKFSLLILLLIPIFVGGFAFWITHTESGLEKLLSILNPIIDTPDSPPAFRISNLSGAIPVDFTFDIESYDKNGTWLTARKNRFVFDWRKLPKTVEIALIESPEIDLSRFPELPPTPDQPDTPEEPFTIKKFQDYLKMAADFLGEKHWWLPEIRIGKVAASATLPSGLIPDETAKEERIRANIDATALFENNSLQISAKASAQNAAEAPLSLAVLNLEKATLEANVKIAPESEGLHANLDVRTNAENPLFRIKEIPANFLGADPVLSLQAEAKTHPESLDIRLNGPNLEAGHLKMTTTGNWQTDAAWANGAIGGPLNCNLAMSLQPVNDPASPLSAIKQPLTLRIAADGTLPTLNLAIKSLCPEIRHGDHLIADTSLDIGATDIGLPLDDFSLAALEKENHLDFQLQSIIDKQKVDLDTKIFFQSVPGSDNRNWRVGLRNLALSTLGMTGTGSFAVLLPKDKKPAIDGALKLAINNWTALNGLLPDQKLSGDLNLDLALNSALPQHLANPAHALPEAHTPIPTARQQIEANLQIPTLKLESGKTQVSIRTLAANLGLTDLFGSPAIKTDINVREIATPPLKLGAKIAANGPLSGPIRASLASTGSITANVAGQWEPGKVQLGTLDVLTDLNQFLPKKKAGKLNAGIRSTQAATITYGDGGLNFRNLDVKILPSGRLAANGGLSPTKLDLDLALNDFKLKPLQVFASAIPAGTVNISAKVSGTPARPAGQFKIDLGQIAIPNSPLKPMNIVVAGNLAHGNGGSALNTRVELDKATVKTLGGEVARIDASIPLLFGADGIPKPNMTGPLAAQIRWDGALGPIWNLVPVADQRLNGRIAIDIAAKGTLESPRINGRLGVNHARYENVAVGVLLTDINADVELKDAGKITGAKGPLGPIPGSMQVNFRLSDGRGGKVTGTGHGNLNGSDLDIRTRIDRLKPLRRRDVHIELSGHAEVTGTALAPVVGGEIVVDKGEVLLNNIVVPGSVTTLPITTPGLAAKMVKAAEAKKLPEEATENIGRINLAINMLPRFSVEGRGLASIWKASLLATGPLNDPKISGNISSVRGNFDFLGKNFALVKGIVFFGGGAISNPLVDIDLEYDTQDLTAHILVTGPVSKIRLNLTSDPTMPRDEIISRVLFGRSLNDLSRMEALQLAGAVAQLAGFGGGSGPLGGVKKALGVDVLRIGTSDTGGTDDDNAGGTNIEMGKYINDFIYMGVQQGFRPDSTAFIIDLELTPRANIELRTEQGNTWGGFKWKYNY